MYTVGQLWFTLIINVYTNKFFNLQYFVNLLSRSDDNDRVYNGRISDIFIKWNDYLQNNSTEPPPKIIVNGKATFVKFRDIFQDQLKTASIVLGYFLTKRPMWYEEFKILFDHFKRTENTMILGNPPEAGHNPKIIRKYRYILITNKDEIDKLVDSLRCLCLEDHKNIDKRCTKLFINSSVFVAKITRKLGFLQDFKRNPYKMLQGLPTDSEIFMRLKQIQHYLA